MERKQDRQEASAGAGAVSADAPAGGAIASNQGLEHDLARFCLEPDTFESKRSLAWMNSICFLYLLVGIIGFKPPALTIVRKALTQEEAVPTVIEPLVTAQAQQNPEEDAPSEREVDTGPPVIAVTMDSSAVAFAVPTVGNVLVALSVAPAPPSNPMKGIAPVSAPKLNVEGGGGSNVPVVEQITITGFGGGRPPPSYPRESLLKKEQGTVLLQIEVSETGKITGVTVKESSGSPRLDTAAADQVRRLWFFEPDKRKRIYECPVVFKLQ